MKGLEELKQEIKEEASGNPEKFFATDVLREKGFSRGRCRKCGMYFWSKDDDREICGEPECGDGYTFINDSPTKDKLSHTESWELFRDFMAERGYEPIDRYPVVARWRDDVEFTGASIYCFQPYVVSGEAEPPADELVIPQPSLRFNDVENVGITGRHYTNFTMIGQTCFQPPESYDQDRYFRDMFEFATQGLGIPEEKLILHEDAWGGGGNLGACMEFFVDGLELFNQVYMFYRQTSEGYEELDLKVLDMGMGHERITWISRGTETSYESVMPETIERLKQRTGLKIDREIWEEFLPHSSELNADEVKDIDSKWKEIAERMDVNVENLREEIEAAAALYSVAEHSRALLFALADGKIPSNTGGGHNLRMIYRRAQDFIEKYGWNVEISEVAEWNAEELEPMFPELKESIDSVRDILKVEKEKYRESREEAKKKLKELNSRPSTEEMIELYESHGVSPKMMEEHGFEVPEDFYSMVSSDDSSEEKSDDRFEIPEVQDTEKLYYLEEFREAYSEGASFEATVEAVVEENWIVLDRTAFYPEGGGQAPDKGKLGGQKVVDVQKQGGVVLHKIPEHSLEAGDKVECLIDTDRRMQLTQHHSATHMVNAAAREELGDHIYQAGASKKTEKARLDLTHYEKPSREEIEAIESAVKKMIDENLPINIFEMGKSAAEQKYGFGIYQGGAPPGNKVRLVEIEGRDVEACGGTHLRSTKEVEDFILTGVKRIQDGVVRLEFKAGEAAVSYREELERLLEQCEKITETKAGEKSRKTLEKLSNIYSVEKSQLPDTLESFKDDIEDLKQEIDEISAYLGEETDTERKKSEKLLEEARSLFNHKKDLKKELDRLKDGIEAEIEKKSSEGRVREDIPTKDVGLLIQLARRYSSKHETTVTLIGEKGAVSASDEGLAIQELDERGYKEIQGDESFAKAFS